MFLNDLYHATSSRRPVLVADLKQRARQQAKDSLKAVDDQARRFASVSVARHGIPSKVERAHGLENR